MFSKGGQIIPPLGSNLMLGGTPNADFFKIHKGYAEFGSYMGTICPHVTIPKTISSILQNTKSLFTVETIELDTFYRVYSH
jgi:hypothetical protein